MKRSRLAACALVAAGLLAAGCGASGLSFVTDERVEILEPRDRASVRLPLEVRWRAEGIEPGGSFGVFVDRAPQPPGETFRWIARDDNGCVASLGCPDQTYLADRGVFATSETTFRIELLPRTVAEEQQRREFHELTIVLLDADGRRVGESAWFVDFQVERDVDR